MHVTYIMISAPLKIHAGEHISAQASQYIWFVALQPYKNKTYHQYAFQCVCHSKNKQNKMIGPEESKQPSCQENLQQACDLV